MDELINKLKGKNIHIIGVTGSEGSNILRFLIKNNISQVKVHDLLIEGSIEKSYKLWHKGIENREREDAYQQFRRDLTHLGLYSGKNYLKEIDKADVVFVPQSWRLYKENLPLVKLNKQKKTVFYSLMRLYLDYARARIVGVTGTVGKGSVANLLFEVLKAGLPAGRQVYFSGNETWRIQLLDRLDSMKKEDVLILEISHRQLLDGFKKSPDILIFTNLSPNHLDEMTFEEYKKLKLSLLFNQTNLDISILNYDDDELKNVADKISSKVYFYSAKRQNMNIKDVQSIYKYFMNNKNLHYFDNILAASTAATQLGIHNTHLIDIIRKIQPLHARLNLISESLGIKFYNDIKSTTPWATLAAVDKLGPNTILICGGKTKGIDYEKFIAGINQKVIKIIFLESELSNAAGKYIDKDELSVVFTLEEAVNLGYRLAKNGDNVLVSPAAGYFYSDFIKDKKSLSKIITSLPLKERV